MTIFKHTNKIELLKLYKLDTFIGSYSSTWEHKHRKTVFCAWKLLILHVLSITIITFSLRIERWIFWKKLQSESIQADRDIEKMRRPPFILVHPLFYQSLFTPWHLRIMRSHYFFNQWFSLFNYASCCQLCSIITIAFQQIIPF